MDEIVAPNLAESRTAAEVVESLRYHLYGMDFAWAPYLPAAPLMLPAAQVDELGQVCVHFLKLLRQATASFGADVNERHVRLGMAPELAGIYGEDWFEEEYADCSARPDVVLTEQGWKIIEFNVGAALGGQPYAHVLGRAWAELYGEPFVSRRIPTDPLVGRRALLDQLCQERGIARRVALLGSRAEIHLPTTRYYDIEVQQLHAAGYEAEYLEPEEFCADPAAMAARFPIAIKRFVSQDWVDQGRDVTLIADIRTSGSHVISPHSARQLSDKRMLAVLSTGQEWMSADDHAFVERYLPWTRVVRDEQVSYRGERRSLADLLHSDPERFVLKPSDQNSSRGVLLGLEATAEEWSTAVSHALNDQTWVVQEYARPQRTDVHLVDMADEKLVTERLPGIISPYLVGRRPCGGTVRIDVRNRDTVVHVGRPGVLATSLIGI